MPPIHRKRSIASEIALVFIAIVLVTIFAGYLMRGLTRQLVSDARDAVWESSVPASFVYRTLGEQWIIHQTLSNALKVPGDARQLRQDIEKLERLTDTRWNELVGLSAYFPEAPKAGIARASDRLSDYRSAYRSMLVQIENHDHAGALAIHDTAATKAVLALAQEASALLGIMDQRIEWVTKRMETTAANGLSDFVLIGSMIGVLLFLAFAVIHFRIAHPISILNRKMEGLAAGDLGTDIPHATRKDEIGRMTDTVAVFKEGLIKINQLVRDLDAANETNTRTNEAMVRALIGLAGARDNETGTHLDRTQQYVGILCRRLAQDAEFAPHLDAAMIERIVSAAPLHDIGKVAVPDEILHKSGKLTDAEYAIMKTHVVEGLAVVDQVIADVGRTPYLAAARDVIAGHHERYDGCGYPHRLSGSEIPLAGRIMALADVYDALRSARVYKPALSHAEARQILIDGAATHFDPKVVSAFLLAEKEFERVSVAISDNASASKIDAAA